MIYSANEITFQKKLFKRENKSLILVVVFSLYGTHNQIFTDQIILIKKYTLF